MRNVQAFLVASVALTWTTCLATPLGAGNLAGRRIELPVHKTPRIRGGVPVGPEEIPYAVGLMIQQPISNRWCGGTLVSRNFVLTAASCFVNPGATTVLLGASNMANVEDAVVATEAILHQAYVPSENLNDLALVRLSRPAVLSNYIRLARLPNWRQADSLFTNQLATVSGWGARGQNTPDVLPLNSLHRVDGAVVGNTACNLQFLGGIAESHVCVATSSGSPCQGDQGGPLTVQDADGGQTVIGVFSFVTWLGCDVAWPAVYTRLTPYLAWIEANSDVTIQNDFVFYPTPPVLQTTTSTEPTTVGTPTVEPTTVGTTTVEPTTVGTTTVEPTTPVESSTVAPTTVGTTTVETTPVESSTVEPTTVETTTVEPTTVETTTVEPTTVDTTTIVTVVPSVVPPHRIDRPVRRNVY